MAVRIRVRISSSRGSEATFTAIAKTGFESDEPEIIISEHLAERLGFYPRLPEGTEVEEYRSVGGRFRAYRIPGLAEIFAETSNKIVGPVDVTVTIVPGEDEALLSDKLIDSLGIELIEAGKGLWRFRGEVDLRKSEPPSLNLGA
jgi:hypothetical protein